MSPSGRRRLRLAYVFVGKAGVALGVSISIASAAVVVAAGASSMGAAGASSTCFAAASVGERRELRTPSSRGKPRLRDESRGDSVFAHEDGKKLAWLPHAERASQAFHRGSSRSAAASTPSLLSRGGRPPSRAPPAL